MGVPEKRVCVRVPFATKRTMLYMLLVSLRQLDLARFLLVSAQEIDDMDSTVRVIHVLKMLVKGRLCSFGRSSDCNLRLLEWIKSA